MRNQKGSRNSNWRGGKSTHPLYGIYNEMVNRCQNETHGRWKDYGGRGIAVCERWLGRDGFWNFVADLGPRPEGVGPAGRSLWSMERVDNDGDYEPGNVVWADQSTQSRNRRASALDGLARWRREGDPGAHNRNKTHCKHGHPFDEANTYINKVTGSRLCRACGKASARRRRDQEAAA